MAEEKQSRLAEMAHELMGAQLVAKLLGEMWEMLSVEDKQRLVLQMAERSVADVNKWRVAEIMEGAVKKAIEDGLIPHVEEMKADALRRFHFNLNENVQKAVNKMTEAAVSAALADVRQKLGDR